MHTHTHTFQPLKVSVRPSLSNIDRRRVREAKGKALGAAVQRPALPLTLFAAPRRGTCVDGRYTQSRLQYNKTDYNIYNNIAKVR